MLCFLSAKMAFPNGTGAGKLSRWTPILTQWPNQKIGALKATDIPKVRFTHHPLCYCLANLSACVLHTVQHARTAYNIVQPRVQCSMLCMPLHLCAPHHLHNANTNRALMRCTTVQTCRVVGRGEALPELVHYNHVQSCSTVHSPLRWCEMRGFPHIILEVRPSLSVLALGAFCCSYVCFLGIGVLVHAMKFEISTGENRTSYKYSFRRFIVNPLLTTHVRTALEYLDMQRGSGLDN